MGGVIKTASREGRATFDSEDNRSFSPSPYATEQLNTPTLPEEEVEEHVYPPPPSSSHSSHVLLSPPKAGVEEELEEEVEVDEKGGTHIPAPGDDVPGVALGALPTYHKYGNRCDLPPAVFGARNFSATSFRSLASSARSSCVSLESHRGGGEFTCRQHTPKLSRLSPRDKVRHQLTARSVGA